MRLTKSGMILVAIVLAACGSQTLKHPLKAGSGSSVDQVSTSAGQVEPRAEPQLPAQTSLLRIENISDWVSHLDIKDSSGNIAAATEVPNMFAGFDPRDHVPGISLNLAPALYTIDGYVKTEIGTLSAQANVTIQGGHSSVLGLTLVWPVSPDSPQLQIREIGTLDADPSSACDDDNDCRLVNSDAYGNCCMAEIDFAQPSWIAVSEFNEKYRPFVCNAACVTGTNKVVNDHFASKCVHNTCIKLAN